MRVLLLDDSGMVRSLMSRLLAEHGWEVLTFPHPVACPLYQSSSCTCNLPEVCADAIVTDFDMPQVDGLSFVKQLLEKGCRIKNLAMLSGTNDSAVLVRAGKLGLRVFTKPDEIPALLEWLRQAEAQIQKERRLTYWSPG